jgi:hypothetical protein
LAQRAALHFLHPAGVGQTHLRIGNVMLGADARGLFAFDQDLIGHVLAEAFDQILETIERMREHRIFPLKMAFSQRLPVLGNFLRYLLQICGTFQKFIINQYTDDSCRRRRKQRQI